jgi:hypothetical protein
MENNFEQRHQCMTDQFINLYVCKRWISMFWSWEPLQPEWVEQIIQYKKDSIKENKEQIKLLKEAIKLYQNKYDTTKNNSWISNQGDEGLSTP